jgi:hypothetical protein
MARWSIALTGVLALSCSTLGTDGEGDRDLPSSGVGPFRKLDGDEVLGTAPFVFADSFAHYREPSALSLSEASPEVALYAMATQRTGDTQRDVFVRTRADDGRSFYGSQGDSGHTPPVVLEPSLPWEGGRISSPSVIRYKGEVWLYYATPAGIALATSSDGLTFKKRDNPIFVADSAISWETDAPHAPSVAVFPDGSLHLFYASGGAIGEATSADGVAFTRVDPDLTSAATDPVLQPAAEIPTASLPLGQKPPFDTLRVDHPCALTRTTVAGRLHVRMLYTGYRNIEGRMVSAIGFAARYGDRGKLVRNTAPVFSVDKHEEAPTFFEWQGGAFLYVHHDGGPSSAPYPAVAGAFAPANERLAKPVGFSGTP